MSPTPCPHSSSVPPFYGINGIKDQGPSLLLRALSCCGPSAPTLFKLSSCLWGTSQCIPFLPHSHFSRGWSQQEWAFVSHVCTLLHHGYIPQIERETRLTLPQNWHWGWGAVNQIGDLLSRGGLINLGSYGFLKCTEEQKKMVFI